MRFSNPIRRTAVALTAGACALALAACGGVTVENGGSEETTTTSLAREDGSETTSSSTTATTTTSTSSREEPRPQDQPGAEISELPETSVERSTEELDLLEGLREGGINVDNREDEMIAAATTVCRSQADGVPNFTLDAISGQLIEQGRADGEVEAISQVITDVAERTYC